MNHSLRLAPFVILLTVLLAPLPFGAPTTAQEHSLDKPVLTVSAENGIIEISWEPVPEAQRYELWIWWSEDTGWQQLADDLTETRFSHAPWTAGTKYWYTAKVVGAAGETSPWADYVSIVAPVTLTPVPTPTSEAYCLLAKYSSYDDLLSASENIPIIQEETRTAYRETFGEDLGSLRIVQVTLFGDDTTGVLYLDEGKSRLVFEYFKGCEFYGHSRWARGR